MNHYLYPDLRRYLRAETEPSEKRIMERHLSICDRCRTYLGIVMRLGSKVVPSLAFAFCA